MSFICTLHVISTLNTWSYVPHVAESSEPGLDSVLSRQDEMDPLEHRTAEVGASLSHAQLCNYCLIRRRLLIDEEVIVLLCLPLESAVKCS